MNARNKVVIIGGGIAGLTAAYRLERDAPNLQLTLLERAGYLGGKVFTESIDGFVVEGGPDSFLATKPWGVDLCRELGLENRLLGTNEAMRRSFVLRNSNLFQIPEGLSGLIPARLEPILESSLFSQQGKQDFINERSVPAGDHTTDESLGSFIRRRFGNELYTRLVEPLMAGIYAGDGDQLSLQSTFPQLHALEQQYGSILNGIDEQHRTTRADAPRAGFLTLRDGMSELVRSLRARLEKTRVETGVNVRSVSPSASGDYCIHLDNEQLVSADAVVVAVPAFEAARVLGDDYPRLGEALSGIPHVSTATVSVAFHTVDLPRTLDGYGYIVPRAERRPVLACSWSSNKFDYRAPDNFSLLRVFLGRAGDDAVTSASDQEMLDVVRTELRDTLGITTQPYLQRIFRWPHGMPQYVVGHEKRLALIQEALTLSPGLALAGNAYRGVGLPDCIHSGTQAADLVRDFLDR